MLIDKSSFSIHFSWFLCNSVVFVLYIISFRKKEDFYVSAIERLRQRGKNETKLNANKNLRTYLLCMKKGVSSVVERVTKK